MAHSCGSTWWLGWKDFDLKICHLVELPPVSSFINHRFLPLVSPARICFLLGWSEHAVLIEGQKNHRIHMLSHGLSSAHMVLIVPLNFMGLLLEALPPVLLQRALFYVNQQSVLPPFLKLTPCSFCISFMQHRRMTPWRQENSTSTHVTCGSSPRDGRFTWISFAIIQTRTGASRLGRSSFLAVES